MQITHLGKFLHERPCVGYPPSSRTSSGPLGRVPDAPPFSKVIAVPFCVTYTLEGRTVHTSL